MAWAGMAAACGGGGGEPVPAAPAPQLGQPNPGLSAATLAAFERGREVFERRFTRAEGHGPHFNTSSCRSCHEMPVTGGSSPRYRNFFLVADVSNNTLVPLLEDGQLVVRTFSYTRPMREAIPASAQFVAQRNAPPLFGIGLFLKLTDQEIFVNADINDLDGDGISGRLNRDSILTGRFGFKAQDDGIENFVRGPLFNHMGITTDPLGTGPGLQPQLPAAPVPTRDDDGVPDPELSPEELSDLVTFTRELAPPPPLPLDAEGIRGRDLFAQIGCTKCHVANLAPAKLPVNPYTDLLIHDMGPDLADGLPFDLATGREFRTQPLWGLRFTAPFLHDGRADTIDEAIRMHGGEAAGIRNAYAALPEADRDAILAFLGSL